MTQNQRSATGTLCQARMVEGNGSRWLCIRIREHGNPTTRDGRHQWAPDTVEESEPQRVNRIMQTVLTEHLSKLQREAAGWRVL